MKFKFKVGDRVISNGIFCHGFTGVVTDVDMSTATGVKYRFVVTTDRSSEFHDGDIEVFDEEELSLFQDPVDILKEML